MQRDYAIGDVCWIEVAGRKALEKGTVVHWFINHVQGKKFFIIQMDDPSFTLLETRDATLMSATADGTLPLDGFVSLDVVKDTGLQ